MTYEQLESKSGASPEQQIAQGDLSLEELHQHSQIACIDGNAQYGSLHPGHMLCILKLH